MHSGHSRGYSAEYRRKLGQEFPATGRKESGKRYSMAILGEHLNAGKKERAKKANGPQITSRGLMSNFCLGAH